ncbi:MAG TPA: UDP-2,3-diacylglucosamine diphosphatase [Terriglobales bacterium]
MAEPVAAPVWDTLILSDLHLGAECCYAREATNLLKQSRFTRLILLGDIFADLNFGRLTKQHWKFLGLIRKLSNPKRNIEVVWVEGNHDHGLADVMSHLVGVRVYQEYTWFFGGKKHLAIHGHQFDQFVVNTLRLNYLGTLLYLQLQHFDLPGKPITRFIDRLNTRWLRMSEKVARGAMFHGRLRRVDRVFCGHTHVAMHQQKDGIDYYNSGGWVDSKLTYLTIDADGVQIHEYRENSAIEETPILAEFSDDSDLLEHEEFAEDADAQYETIAD